MRPICDIFHSYGVLDAQGRHINGTDKQTNHAYGDAYESLFMVSHPDDPTIPSWSIRGGVKLMMEVGVADGSSLLAWREVFPNALCVGMDIHRASKIDELLGRGERLEIWLGDQRVQKDCEQVAGQRQFDFICEDATHRLEDSLRTLLFLWPFVRVGGIYVIEEFDGVGGLRQNIAELFPFAQVVDTVGPFGGVEPLVVFKKARG